METYAPFKAKDGTYRMRHGSAWATFLLNDELMVELDEGTFEQIRASMELPGIEKVTITPDAHRGYGVIIGTSLESSDYLYPDTTGIDPSCAVSISKLDVDFSGYDKKQKREIINKLEKLVGVGNQLRDTGTTAAKFFSIINGNVRPPQGWVHAYEPLWKERLNSPYSRLRELIENTLTENMLKQFMTIGGGNHALAVECTDDGQPYLVSHFGSRGIGASLAKWFDTAIRAEIEKWTGKPHTGLLYLPAESDMGKLYYFFNLAMLEFSGYNHHLIHTSIMKELDWKGDFLGHVPHNFIEYRNGRYVGRKGTIPAYDNQGIPLVVLGNMTHGSAVFSPGKNAAKYGESLAHGAGRRFSRSEAKKTLDQKQMDAEFDAAGVMGNFRNVPIDEAHDAYKDFDQIVQVTQDTGVGVLESRIRPLLVLKGG